MKLLHAPFLNFNLPASVLRLTHFDPCLLDIGKPSSSISAMCPMSAVTYNRCVSVVACNRRVTHECLPAVWRARVKVGVHFVVFCFTELCVGAAVEALAGGVAEDWAQHDDNRSRPDLLVHTTRCLLLPRQGYRTRSSAAFPLASPQLQQKGPAPHTRSAGRLLFKQPWLIYRRIDLYLPSVSVSVSVSLYLLTGNSPELRRPLAQMGPSGSRNGVPLTYLRPNQSRYQRNRSYQGFLHDTSSCPLLQRQGQTYI